MRKALTIFGVALCGAGLLWSVAGAARTPERRPTGNDLLDRVRYAPAPDPEAFYAQPDPFPSNAPPGTVLASRKVPFRPGLSIPLPGEAWQLQYVTKDVHGRRLAAVTTVVKPTAVSPTGTKPLLSYQFAYDSLGAQCTPSRTLTGGTANYNNQAETLSYVLAHLALGWTIVLPDYEGPYSAFGAGRMSGQATLDSIRAALSFADLGLDAGTPVGMMGYSGGALATTWAATLQPAYAPELKLAGVAAGGVPADVLGIVRHVDGGPFFGLIFGAVVGANRAYPQLLPEPVLNDAGRALMTEMKDGCVGENTTKGMFTHLTDYTTTSDPFNSPGALKIAPLVTLPQADQTPAVDMFVYHEVLDEIIPVAGADALVAAWCAKGVPISYLRGLGGEHVSGAVAYALPALAYFQARFEGASASLPGAQRCN